MAATLHHPDERPGEHRHAASGGACLKVSEPSDGYDTSTSERLRHWAQVAPGRNFMARRSAEGTWRHLTYGQALDGARALAQALLDRGLSIERPVLILSGNDLEHALLALACQYVGVPYAPIAPAHSLRSRNFDKLGHVARLLGPGLIFAADGERFGAAIAAVAGPETEVVVAGRPRAAYAATLFADLLATLPGPEVEAARRATGPDTIVKFVASADAGNMPEVAAHTQRMLCSDRGILRCEPFGSRAQPVLTDSRPWSNAPGWNIAFNRVLASGGTLCIGDRNQPFTGTAPA